MTALDAATTELACDVPAAAQQLIAGLMAEPWGQVSPSIYETGRLVTLAPWLSGHTVRVGFLLDKQETDGRWGAPHDGYALVPTLSATEALLSRLAAGDPAIDRAAAAAAAAGGLGWLRGRLSGAPLALPDMPAIELITASLVASINTLSADLADIPAEPALRPPAAGADELLQAVRKRFAAGTDLPKKLLHALEIGGEAAFALAAARPEITGTIGASPAATAAWLGGREPEPSNPARWHLEVAVARHGGPVPCGLPITVFERAWALSWLRRAGVAVSVPPEMVLSLTAPLRSDGTPAGDGLPPDADTTSVTLYALAKLGIPHPPDVLRAYELDSHFCTWPGEQGFSVSTNAHVLDAFGQFTAVRPETAADHRPTIDKVTAVLCEAQREDGSWLDRWHVSPYYATACCAMALAEFGGSAGAAAVRKAILWIVESQRPDGGWGVWNATREETAYALHVLHLALRDSADRARSDRAVLRGREYLLRSSAMADDPPLWIDKDLYRPTAIVQATILAAVNHAGTPLKLG